MTLAAVPGVRIHVINTQEEYTATPREVFEPGCLIFCRSHTMTQILRRTETGLRLGSVLVGSEGRVVLHPDYPSGARPGNLWRWPDVGRLLPMGIVTLPEGNWVMPTKTLYVADDGLSVRTDTGIFRDNNQGLAISLPVGIKLRPLGEALSLPGIECMVLRSYNGPQRVVVPPPPPPLPPLEIVDYGEEPGEEDGDGPEGLFEEELRPPVGPTGPPGAYYVHVPETRVTTPPDPAPVAREITITEEELQRLLREGRGGREGR